MVVQKRAKFLAPITVALTACAGTPSPQRLANQSGMELYETLCASCHGTAGQGDGPVAPLIKTRVPDLTRLAHRDGGEFPTEDVRAIIDGRFDCPAHGPRDMPVWGWQFYDSTSTNDAAERARADMLIDRLVRYLESIQRDVAGDSL